MNKEKIENPVNDIILTFSDTFDPKKEVIEKEIEEKLLFVGITGIKRIESIETEHRKWNGIRKREDRGIKLPLVFFWVEH